MLYQVHLTWAGFELTTLVVIDTDCKSNYHTIMSMTAFVFIKNVKLQNVSKITCIFFFVNIVMNTKIHNTESVWLEANLCKVLLFVYICIAVEIQLSRSDLTLSSFCACPKSGPWFLHLMLWPLCLMIWHGRTHVIVGFVDIVEIVNNYFLNFLVIIIK